MKKVKNFFRRWHAYCPVFAIVMSFLTPAALLLHLLSIKIPAVADFVNRTISAGVRFLLAKITGIFPFSLAEMLVYLILPAAVVAIIFAVKLAKKPDPKPSRYMLSYLLAGVATLYTLFVFTLGTSYFGTPIHEEMGLDRKDVSAEELFETAKLLLEKTDALLDEIEFDENGASVMPYDLSELNRKLNEVYKEAGKEYAFLSTLTSRVKPVLASEPLTYTHLSGIYSYMTGEANINTNFPDGTIPQTMAHEMAHQRGIAKEDEANFVAFLICSASDDPFIRYSGYVETFKYFVNALAAADKDLFQEIYAIADDRIVGEILAFNEFFEKYEDNAAASVSEAVNNAYQQIQGVKEGIQSYGLVVDLTVAYFKANPEAD